MTRNPRLTAFRLVAGALLPAILSVSTLQAAETVRWAELPSKLWHDKPPYGVTADREYSIVTKTGEIYRGRKLVFSPWNTASVTDSGPSFSGEEVAEVRIRHHLPWGEAIALPVFKVVFKVVDEIDGSEERLLPSPAVYLSVPVLIGVGVATAPVVAVVEGIRRMRPARVIKIVP